MKKLLLLFLILSSYTGFSDPPFKFERFTINDGLSNNSVRRIIQDKKGYLWFGTLNGLSRYDGKNFRTFKSEPGNSNSLTNNRIHLLMEDSHEYIWIGTFNNEIHRFNPQTETFLNIDRMIKDEDPNYLVRPKSIAEGSPGVIWITTENGGLIRFMVSEDPDKYQIDIFDSSNLLPDNNVHFLKMDKSGALWIGTSKGLLRLETDNFTGIPVAKSYFENNHVDFTKVSETENHIWFGSEKGIFRYSFLENEFSAWDIGLPNSQITAMGTNKKEDGVLITTSKNGLIYISDNGNKREHHLYPFLSKSLKEEEQHYYNRLYADKNGMFWLVNPYRRGITLFDPQSRQFRYFDLNAKSRESLGENEKHIFYEDSNGYLWIGIYGGGIGRFNHEKMEFDISFYNKDNPESLSSNLVLSILEDRSKNLWVGTFQGGLNKLSLHRNNFTYTEPKPKATIPFENEVRSMTEDKFGRLWVGTKAGKVLCYDQNNEYIFTVPDDLPSQSSFFMHSVYSLLDDKDGNLWIGTKSDGLFRIMGLTGSPTLKSKNFKVDNFKKDSRDPYSISVNTVYSLIQDNHGQIWIGTYNGGLNLIKDPQAQKITFEHFKHGLNSSVSLSDNRVRQLLLDKDNNLWIGTSNGLNMLKSESLNSENKIFYRFMRNPSIASSLSNNDIICLHQDKENNIWAGTYGGGLNELTMKNGEIAIRHFTQEDGLPSDIIFSILEDESGYLWVGSDNGLSKFNPYKELIENYQAEDGLGENIFSEATAVKMRNGNLNFGHLKGFLHFYPDEIRKNDQPYPIVFTELRIFNERVKPGAEGSPLSRSLNKTDEIILSHDQNFFTIEFGVLDFKAPDKIKYAYVLENFEKDWNSVIGQNQAIYKGMSPGEYIFKVKGTNSDGVWMDEIRSLKIKVLPPFWKTYWAYTIYAFLILGSILIIAYFIRTEIRLQNEVILERRLTENKLKFYTNISHEFKTPLTLICGPTEDIINDISLPSHVKKKAELIKRNSVRLLHLVEELLEFRRIQNNLMELRTQRIDLFNFFNDIYLSFLPMANKKNVTFKFKSNFSDLTGWIDPKHVEKIVMNLLSNAFKYSGTGKNICLKTEVSGDGKMLKIKVEDKGTGISKENIGRIFDRFNLINNEKQSNSSTSGIGLSLTKDLTKLHKGEISVESTETKGSIFIVSIPIGDEHYNENEKLNAVVLDHVPPGKTFHYDFDEHEHRHDEQIKAGRSATKNSLLIIEDNKELSEYLADKFKKYYNVSIANDGNHGLDTAAQIMPDLIICDVMMPGMDGNELTQTLKNNINTSHIPLILLTACSTDEQKMLGIEAGADDYITKPFHFEYLKVRAEKLIEQRKKLREKFSTNPNIKVSDLSGASADQVFLDKVITLVEGKMGDPDFNVDHLIKELSCSRTFFYKKIKGISGYSPNEFVRTIRMKKAALMLKSGDFTVAETSYEVGISDPNYFSKCFKNHFGESPSDYCKKFKTTTL